MNAPRKLPEIGWNFALRRQCLKFYPRQCYFLCARMPDGSSEFPAPPRG